MVSKVFIFGVRKAYDEKYFGVRGLSVANVAEETVDCRGNFYECSSVRPKTYSSAFDMYTPESRHPFVAEFWRSFNIKLFFFYFCLFPFNSYLSLVV